MVMITRSAYKKATESLDSSDTSQRNNVPPWCSSGKVYERKNTRRAALPLWEAQSSYPLRENIWEFLNDKSRHSGNTRIANTKRTKKCKQKHRRRKVITYLMFCLVGFGLLVPFWIPDKISKVELLKAFLPNTNLYSNLLGLVNFQSTSVSEDCCHKLKHLTLTISRIERELRNALRLRKKLMLTSLNTKESDSTSRFLNTGYIDGAKAFKGSSTVELGTQVALWGVIPLWRTAPSPDIILTLRKPTPSDCWPFSGSIGEILIELPRKMLVQHISLEHVRPDTAKSAPKDFEILGVLENDTYVKAVDGIYLYNEPAKQYYSLNTRNTPLRRIVFRVLSNHGNPKYTCIYRVHLYGYENMLASLRNI